jgi:spermidine synthase
MSSVSTKAALFGLGFISVGTQVYLLRESYIVFYGNELTFGLVLGIWMLLTGAGSWLGRFAARVSRLSSFLLFLMILLSVLPVLMIAKLHLYRALVLPAGVMAGPGDVLNASALVQLPFCLISGFLFSALSLQSGDTGKAYFLESAGSLLSGAVVNFLLIWVLPLRYSLLVLSGGYMITVFIYSFCLRMRTVPWIILALLALILVLLGKLDLNRTAGISLFPGQQVAEEIESPYGQVSLTLYRNQMSVYANGLLLCSSGDEISNEENVHYAMLQRSGHRKVLLVGGGYSGAIGEILKYGPSGVDYLEINPALLKISSATLNELQKNKVFLHREDARMFVRNSTEEYDAALIILPPPSSLQLNRFYSREFMEQLKSRLSADGVVSFSLPTTSDYVSGSGRELNSRIYSTIKSLFKNVLIIPGGKTFFLASDGSLSIGIPGLSDRSGIQTAYVNRYYLDSLQMKERSDFILADINKGAPVNRDFDPGMFFAQMNYWLSYFNGNYWFIMVVALLLILPASISLNPVSAGLFTGGFTVGSLQVLLLFTMQVWCGYVFQLTGALVMVFMGGMVAGSKIRDTGYGIRDIRSRIHTLFSRIPNPESSYLFTLLLLALISLFSTVLISVSSLFELPVWLGLSFAGVAVLTTGFLMGRLYVLAAGIGGKDAGTTASRNYSADLFGSAAGAILTPILLFPLMGLFLTGILLAILNVGSAFWLWSRSRNFVSL